MITIHLVPNAHLDVAWLWDWREGLNEGIATCRAMADLMEEQPDVTFTRNEAFIYHHIETYAPPLFERIRRLIAAGQWEIAGGAMLQPDTNLGSGESYVRQYLYGQEYFRSRFNQVPEVAYQVDSFGHASILPSIYRAVGCRYAVQCRPSQVELPTKSRIFRWRGPDKAEVLTANLESYGLEVESQDPLFTISARIQRAVEQVPEGLNDWLLLAGFGDHGGGLNRKLIEEIRRLMAHPPSGCVIVFSTLKKFFTAIESRLDSFPVIQGELQFCNRGCFTSAASIKRAYCGAEGDVDTAERWAVVADMLGKRPYPADDLKTAWKDILFNQFHDILPGSSIEPVYREAQDHLGRARHVSREVMNNSALPVFLEIDTASQEGVPVLLFNPHAYPYQGPVEVEWMPEYRPLGPLGANGERHIVKWVRAVEPGGEACQTQFLATESHMRAEWRFRNCFEVQVPACGYAVYWLQRVPKPIDVQSDITVAETGTKLRMANSRIHVEWRQGENGIRAHDPAVGREWFTEPAAVGLVLDDPGDSWGGGIESWNTIKGVFKTEETRILDKGPIKASIVQISRYHDSRLMQIFSITRNSPRIHCSVRLLWNEPRSLMKLVFPFNVRNPKGVFSSPYAVVERPVNSGEVFSNRWIMLKGDDSFSLGLAHQGQYGCDTLGNQVRLSVVRSPWYGSTGVQKSEGWSERPCMEIGLHCFDYVLAPGDDVETAADFLNGPLHVTLGSPHPGSLPATQSVIAVEPRTVHAVAFKKAENGKGWIVRLWEAKGMHQTAVISVMNKRIGEVAIGPWQILTVRLSRSKNQWKIAQTTLMEK